MGPAQEDRALKTALFFSGLAARATAPEPEATFSRQALDRVAPLVETAFGTFSSWSPALLGREHTDPLHHVALYLYGVAAYDTWTERHGPPAAVAGYSLGVYVSLVVSDALDPENALSLVLDAGQGVLDAQAVLGHGLVAVNGLTVNRVPELLSGILAPEEAALTHVNTADSFILTAPRAAIDELCARALSLGAFTAVPAPFPGSSHSHFLVPHLATYFRTLETLELRVPRFPLFSCVTADRVRTAEEVRNLIRDQIIRPVLLLETIECMSQPGTERFVVMGTCEGLAALLAYLKQDADVRLFPGAREGGDE